MTSQRKTIGAAAAITSVLALAAPAALAYTVYSPDARDANLAALHHRAAASVPRSPDAADLNRFARNPSSSQPKVIRVAGRGVTTRVVIHGDAQVTVTVNGKTLRH
jgi:hypothetical protein